MAYLLAGCHASEKLQLKFTEIEKIAKSQPRKKKELTVNKI